MLVKQKENTMSKSKENLLAIIDKQIKYAESEKQNALEIYKSSRANSVSQAKWGELASQCWKRQELLYDLKDEINIQLID